MDERNLRPSCRKERKKGARRILDLPTCAPPPPTVQPFARSLKGHQPGTYRSTPPLWFHSPRERESSAMVPTVPFHPFFFYEREKRSSAWNPSLPPSLFHRSSAWDLPFNPPERVIGQVPYRSTSFFLRERERSSAWTYRSTPPSLVWLPRERESHRPWCLPFDPLQRDLLRQTKKEPRLFFFFASPNTHRPIYK